VWVARGTTNRAGDCAYVTMTATWYTSEKGELKHGTSRTIATRAQSKERAGCFFLWPNPRKDPRKETQPAVFIVHDDDDERPSQALRLRWKAVVADGYPAVRLVLERAATVAARAVVHWDGGRRPTRVRCLRAEANSSSSS
jgi:hypothetical protein